MNLKTLESHRTLLLSLKQRAEGGRSIRLSNYDVIAISGSIELHDKEIRENGGE